MSSPQPARRQELSDSPLSTPINDHWDIKREEVEFIRKLGSGKYGDVWLGCWDNATVAVKVHNPGTGPWHNFLKEVAVMKNLQHEHLVETLAICSKSKPIFMVQEYMENGTLLEFLTTGRGQTFQGSDLLVVAAQIASGLRYMAHNRLVHRFVAAKNIMVGVNNTVKMSNFHHTVQLSSTSNEYNLKTGAMSPLRWTAPEAIKSLRFSTASDVWSYGIVLMEVFTFGKTPYSGMDTRELIQALYNGYRMPQPAGVRDDVYCMMERCWQMEPKKRPNFDDLLNFFNDLIAEPKFDTLPKEDKDRCWALTLLEGGCELEPFSHRLESCPIYHFHNDIYPQLPGTPMSLQVVMDNIDVTREDNSNYFMDTRESAERNLAVQIATLPHGSFWEF